MSLIYAAQLYKHVCTFLCALLVSVYSRKQVSLQVLLKVPIAIGVCRSGSAEYENAQRPIHAIVLDTFGTQKTSFPAERRDLSGTYGLSRAAR